MSLSQSRFLASKKPTPLSDSPSSKSIFKRMATSPWLVSSFPFSLRSRDWTVLAAPQASAVHIAHYLTRVPSIGKALAQGITEQRAQFLESELAIKAVEAHAEAGSRELTGAYYRAVSVLAQAKAFLAVKGVVVRDRKPAVRRKKALAVVPTASQRTVRPSSTAVPAPAPTPLPMPEAA